MAAALRGSYQRPAGGKLSGWPAMLIGLGVFVLGVPAAIVGASVLVGALGRPR